MKYRKRRVSLSRRALPTLLLKNACASLLRRTCYQSRARSRMFALRVRATSVSALAAIRTYPPREKAHPGGWWWLAYGSVSSRQGGDGDGDGRSSRHACVCGPTSDRGHPAQLARAGTISAGREEETTARTGGRMNVHTQESGLGANVIAYVRPDGCMRCQWSAPKWSWKKLQVALDGSNNPSFFWFVLKLARRLEHWLSCKKKMGHPHRPTLEHGRAPAGQACRAPHHPNMWSLSRRGYTFIEKILYDDAGVELRVIVVVSEQRRHSYTYMQITYVL